MKRKVWLLVVWNEGLGMWEPEGKFGTVRDRVRLRGRTEVPCTLPARVIPVTVPPLPPSRFRRRS